MLRYMMRQATSEIVLKSTTNDKTYEGRELSRLLEQVTQFERYCARFARRLGNDTRLLKTLLDAFNGKDGILYKNKLKLRQVFEKEELMAQIEGKVAEAGYKTELLNDEEHGLAEIEITFANGTPLIFMAKI